jgi:hypothetical protein
MPFPSFWFVCALYVAWVFLTWVYFLLELSVFRFKLFFFLFLFSEVKRRDRRLRKLAGHLLSEWLFFRLPPLKLKHKLIQAHMAQEPVLLWIGA